MIYFIAGLIGFLSSLLFFRFDFMPKLKTIWQLNQVMLDLIQSDTSDEIKQQGILKHSLDLFKASILLFLITIVTLMPLSFYACIFWNEIQLPNIMLLSSLLNLVGFLLGLFLFRSKHEK
ncbi:hypothetical protein [Aquirufa sp. TARAVU-A1A]